RLAVSAAEEPRRSEPVTSKGWRCAHTTCTNTARLVAWARRLPDRYCRDHGLDLSGASGRTRPDGV
ncbi:MAG: hypothetical protein ACHRXM_01450, partial [Isosphaerales bacterium]